jgi:hypothetical protein
VVGKRFTSRQIEEQGALSILGKSCVVKLPTLTIGDFFLHGGVYGILRTRKETVGWPSRSLDESTSTSCAVTTQEEPNTAFRPNLGERNVEKNPHLACIGCPFRVAQLTIRRRRDGNRGRLGRNGNQWGRCRPFGLWRCRANRRLATGRSFSGPRSGARRGKGHRRPQATGRRTSRLRPD